MSMLHKSYRGGGSETERLGFYHNMLLGTGICLKGQRLIFPKPDSSCNIHFVFL